MAKAVVGAWAVERSRVATIGAAFSKLGAKLGTFASQLGALKAPSAAAATVQKYVALSKEYAAALVQAGKAISANDQSAFQALRPKIATLKQEWPAAGAQVTAAIP